MREFTWGNLIGTFNQSGSPLAKQLASEGPETMRERIISSWVEGSTSIYFAPNPINRESLNSYSGDLIFKSKGMEAISIPIRLI